MDIIIQSLGFRAGEKLEDFVREKVNTLKGDRIVRANVTLFKGPESEPENNYCEIRLEVPGNDHFVKKNGAYFETAISECVDVLTLKLKDEKDKRTNRKADAAVIQDIAQQSDDNDNWVDLEEVVK
ncbi:HPF/RaiA family ribosome-associated protein [Nostoc ellipsosporum NOK]|jgi:putative sigma-54 modulation protein|nr:HPF/RaiA family ribosome-associated protein [Nostoc ellipsosporum NOK]